ncbi:MAG: hypothetical protein JWM74_232 [Myxococcaceae bacterium]|jgi:hypothetical protein|nr:hypothetical protein [Myxococcaceae bacterium]
MKRSFSVALSLGFLGLAALVPTLLVPGCGDSATPIPSDAGFGTVTKDGGGSIDDAEAPTDAEVTDTGTIIPPKNDAAVWPDCKTQPSAAPAKTISEIWTSFGASTTPNYTWITGAYVTAVSRGGCTAGRACQIFLQSDPGYATLAAATHKSIKVFASAATGTYFSGIAVGDKIDALGWAWRYTKGGQNELLLEVNAQLPGCARKVGSATLTPIPNVLLSDLTTTGYETTYGPLFVEVPAISGTPVAALEETFGLYPTLDGGGFDGGGEIVSLSPFFLPGSTFTNPPLSPSKKTFQKVTGVFGLFVPSTDAATATKYLEIYPRTMADIVVN